MNSKLVPYIKLSEYATTQAGKGGAVKNYELSAKLIGKQNRDYFMLALERKADKYGNYPPYEEVGAIVDRKQFDPSLYFLKRDENYDYHLIRKQTSTNLVKQLVNQVTKLFKKNEAQTKYESLGPEALAKFLSYNQILFQLVEYLSVKSLINLSAVNSKIQAQVKHKGFVPLLLRQLKLPREQVNALLKKFNCSSYSLYKNVITYTSDKLRAMQDPLIYGEGAHLRLAEVSFFNAIKLQLLHTLVNNYPYLTPAYLLKTMNLWGYWHCRIMLEVMELAAREQLPIQIEDILYALGHHSGDHRWYDPRFEQYFIIYIQELTSLLRQNFSIISAFIFLFPVAEQKYSITALERIRQRLAANRNAHRQAIATLMAKHQWDSVNLPPDNARLAKSDQFFINLCQLLETEQYEYYCFEKIHRLPQQFYMQYFLQRGLKNCLAIAVNKRCEIF
jgi:hypothetical protein